MHSLNRLLFLVIPLGLILSFAVPVWGQEIPRCQSRDGMLADLKQHYQEEPVSRGTVNGNVVEVLASADGRTWTLIVTDPLRASCVIAAGEDWEVYPVKMGRPS